MTQKSIKTFINEINSKPPKRNYPTNKTDVCHIDDIWRSLDILDLKDYGPKNNRGYRYVSVIREKLIKGGWTVSLKNKNSTKKDSFENILISSKRKPNLIETDRGKECYNNIFQDFLKTQY